MASSSLRALLIVAITTILAVIGSNLIIYVTDLLLPNYAARFDNYAFATGIPLAVSPLLIVPLAYAIYRMTELQAVLERNIRTDALTGLLNRRGFFDHAQRVFDQFEDGAQPIAVMMADVDRFKEINDLFGHAVGDDVLRGITQSLCEAIGSESPHNVVARIGGDEFVVLLAGLDPAAVGATAERICRAVGRPKPDADPAITVPSVSIGAAMRLPNEPIDVVMKAADAAAYEAKRAGRDRWVLANPPAAAAQARRPLVAA
jgi:diguanylate cyclase (GGDEF)-like protein